MNVDQQGAGSMAVSPVTFRYKQPVTM